MNRYVIRRILQGAVVVWAAYTLTFAMLFMMPGDPVQIMLGGEADSISSVEAEAIRAEYGLDRPIWGQYVHWLGGAVRGDLGNSFQTGTPVLRRLLDAMPSTLALASTALGLAVALALVVGVLGTYVRTPWLRGLFLSLPGLGVAVPNFWLGVLLLQHFSFSLGWFPAVGNDGLRSLVLPSATIAVPAGAVLAQVLAQSLRSTLAEPYVDVLRARGASRARIYVRHAMRNASLPTLTLVGMFVGAAISGAAVAETVFSRAGLGRLSVVAVQQQDLPMVLGLVFFAAVATVVTTLVVDLLYVAIDPRTRTGLTSRRRRVT